MAVSLKEKQPRASAPWLSLVYIACKLMTSGRTTRIKNTTELDESIGMKPGDVLYHQSCASFLKNFSLA